jgi:DNA-binding transcriptional regulator YdaS (Cro superfamily)
MINLKQRALWVRVYRNRKQKDMAVALNVTEPEVSVWIHRKRPVPRRYVKAFAELLEIPQKELPPPC